MTAKLAIDPSVASISRIYFDAQYGSHCVRRKHLALDLRRTMRRLYFITDVVYPNFGKLENNYHGLTDAPIDAHQVYGPPSTV
jgi:hypothetical protein